MTEREQAETSAWETYQELKILLEEIQSDDCEIVHSAGVQDLQKQFQEAERVWREFGTSHLRAQIKCLTERLAERGEAGAAIIERDPNGEIRWPAEN